MKLDETKTLAVISSLIIILNISFIFFSDVRFLLLSTLGIAIVISYYVWGFIAMFYEFGRIITIEVDLDLIQLVLFFSSVIFTLIMIMRALIL
jgi:hypothetical protein